jgi:hypothetical protein
MQTKNSIASEANKVTDHYQLPISRCYQTAAAKKMQSGRKTINRPDDSSYQQSVSFSAKQLNKNVLQEAYCDEDTGFNASALLASRIDKPDQVMASNQSTRIT